LIDSGFTPVYEEKELKNLKIEKEIEERCKDYLNLVEARLGNLESKIDNIDQVKAMIVCKFDLAQLTCPTIFSIILL
jgi:hypothetical protein